ncbi:efflux RND transporter permease subunit [Mesobaculum littorinae]|uniref:Efflux RND transporter permease subunit n=1 Tax=Mesobaculum littorinae TaxID=2486419 RepID=A0A438AGC5_9RHOB|nr:efflux RND transporter permease subunit [Mesobaculum littorinae]RVV97763.1 efflux RND transporter permease subunit [Mesobaculum littorinae]
MKALIRQALETRVFPNLLMIGLVVAGLLSLATITVKNFPDLYTGAVQVTVVYPGATPEDVANSIVEPMETALRGLDGIRKITATASEGQAQVTADLTRGAEVQQVRDDIETEVGGITVLPAAAEEPVVVELEPDELAIQFVLSGDLPAQTLKDLAVGAREDLQGIEGISQVEISGLPEDQIAVEVPEWQLLAYGTDLGTLASRIEAATADFSAGTLTGADERIAVRAAGERQTGAELSDLILFSSPAGAQVPLGDVARITDGLSEEPMLAELGEAPAIFLNVYRAGSEPLLNVVDLTRSYVQDDLRPRLPDTVTVTEWRNEATSLRGRINLLVKNALLGAALILVVLTLTLDLRIAAWVASGVAISFAGTFVLMSLFGVSLNQLTLFGFILSLGIVVDDAIVVGEAVYTERQSGKPGRQAAMDGAGRMARPIFYSVSTTILAFLPLLLLPGESGSFLTPVAAVVIMVLVLSLIESFFILPQHLAGLRTGEPRRFSPRRLTDPLRARVGGRIDRFADTRVRRWGDGIAAHPGPVLVLCTGLLLASLAPLTSGLVRFVFFPDIEGNFVSAALELPEGTSAAATRARAADLSAAMDRAAGRLAEQSETGADDILQATAITIGVPSVGGPGGSGGVQTSNTARVEVKVADAETRDFEAAQLVDLWRQEAGEIPGARSLSFSSSEVGLGADLELNVSADTPEARADAVARIREDLATRPGVTAVRDSEGSASEEVVVDLSDRGRALGLSLADVAQALRDALYGAVATEIQRDREEVEVRVRLPQSDRDTLADLENLRLPVGGALVPLREVATLSFQPSPATVTRIDGRRVTTISADVTGEATTGGAEAGRILDTLVPQLQKDHPGLRVTLGGEQEEQSRFGPALGRNVAVALFGIYALLALAFRSYVRPVLLLIAMPFGMMGTILGHWALGLDLTLLSMFGLIGLLGILMNDALLLVMSIFERVEAGDDRPIGAAMAERLRPILLTTLTTFLGVTPLILETSLQAQFLIPTAVALGFGLLGGSVMTMAVVPAATAIYLRLHKRWKPSGNRADDAPATA